MTTTLSRREFLRVSAAAGGAFCLELALPGAGRAQSATPAGTEVNAWVLVRPDEDVIIRIARSEMGQGSQTGLAMLVVEELECDWSRVRTEFVSVAEHLRRDRVWGSMSTGGSQAIRQSQEYLRRAGATAREMLVAAAARGWSVPAGECHVAKGVIAHRPTGRSTTYGKVAAAAAQLAPPRDVKLKEPGDWTLIGKGRVQRFDLADKILGRPVYAIDVELPGMVHAALMQCPVFGGKLRRVNKAGALALRGVKRVVELPDAVAVVADNWWRANKALAALDVEWDTGADAHVDSAAIMAFLRSGLAATDLPVARRDGDVDAAFAQAAKTVEAEYFTPFLSHATMEPQTCTAWFHDDRLDVWAPTQNGEATAAAAAEAGGVPLSRVEVHKMQLGGGFGRRGASQDFTRYAVRIASQLRGTPVKMLWSREEDMQHDFYRPASLVKLKAGLDAGGRMTAWHTRIACPSIVARMAPERLQGGLDPQACGSFVDSPYAVPNARVDYAMRNPHVPVGFWRSVYHSQNPFFRECFIDEVAQAGGKDPLEFRRALLAGPRGRRDLAILDAVAKAAGWGSPLPAGVFRGIAVADGYGSYAAGVIELSVNTKNEISLRRVIVGVDPGYVVNVDAAKAQIEGCVIYGLTAAMYGENTVKDGRVVESNFHDYRMLLLRDTPRIEAVLAPTGGFWGGMGEPPMTPIAPALVNAIAAATGRRVRSLPLRNHGFALATSA
jgi:isoquinoline 1-oxidoreductase beta subunit